MPVFDEVELADGQVEDQVSGRSRAGAAEAIQLFQPDGDSEGCQDPR
jgi:hypothetical protein